MPQLMGQHHGDLIFACGPLDQPGGHKNHPPGKGGGVGHLRGAPLRTKLGDLNPEVVGGIRPAPRQLIQETADGLGLLCSTLFLRRARRVLSP